MPHNAVLLIVQDQLQSIIVMTQKEQQGTHLVINVKGISLQITYLFCVWAVYKGAFCPLKEDLSQVCDLCSPVFPL